MQRLAGCLLCTVAFNFLHANDEEEKQTTPPPVEHSFSSETAFAPFTGKITGRKVRMRAAPDLESHVIRELIKNDLISVVGEDANFYAIEPPSGIKAFVFRSFILDGQIEGHRVNVRLHPDLEAPVIAHLNTGDKISGAISADNHKWLEIEPPANTRFYISKDFVQYMGGPEVKVQLDKRRETVEQMIDATALLSKAELRKSFREMDIKRITRNYQTIISEYTDFPEYVELAKAELTKIQEIYLEKKISYLEEKIGDEALQELDTQEEDLFTNANDRMKMWQPVEEAIYLTWTHMNESRPMGEFYADERLAAVELSGIVEVYSSPVKNKPGDYILRNNGLPVAYLYSTEVNLHEYLGKRVSILGSPRDNHNFAFPAYFVHSAE